MNTRKHVTRTVESLEARLMLFNTGGSWSNPDDLSFSYSNAQDGGILDSAGVSLSAGNIRSAILEGMSIWTGVAPIKIHQETDAGPGAGDLPYINLNAPKLRFGHHNIDGTPANNDALAHTFGPDALNSLAGDVHFDDANAFATSPIGGNGSPFDILEVAAHEIGHALGMHHDNTFNALMNDTYAGMYSGFGSAFLLADDINGIQSLYGTGLGYVLTDADHLWVSGTESNDEITVDYDSGTDELVVESVGIGSFRIDEDEVSQILIFGHGGNDTIRIKGLDGDTTAVVNAGSGNDTINVGDGDLNTNVLSAVTVNGDSGDDLLIIRDGDDDGGTYNITPQSLQKTNSQLVSWTVGDTESLQVVGTEFTDTFNLSGNVSASSDMEIELQGNGGSDTFNINEVDDRADVTLLGGNDTDTFNIGNGDYDTNIDGNVTVDGDSGGDILTVNDRDDVGSMDVYTINASTFEKDGSDGVLTFSDVSTFNVDGSADGTEFKILGTASGTTVNVDGRGGDDEFNVSDYDYDSAIFGTLSINGGGGTGDFMEIRDSSDQGNDDYYFDVSATFGPYFDKSSGPLTIFNDTLEQIHMQANNDNNDIFVGDTEFGTAITLYGLSGNDSFYIGTTDAAVDGDLDPIDDTLVIWAGAGTDTVTYNDAADAPHAIGQLNDSYRITESSVTKTQGLPLTSQQFDYFEVESLKLECNVDSNTITVESTDGATNTTVYGNDGDEHYNFGLNNNVKDIKGLVEASGGAGTDSLTYDDQDSTQAHSYTVSPNNITRTNPDVGAVRPFVDSIVVNAGLGADTLSVTNNVPTTVSGGGGNDAFVVAGGVWDFAILGELTIDGGADTDSLVIDDTTDVGADAYTVTATQSTKNTPFARPINYTTIESYELQANSDANIITVNSTFDGDFKLRGRGGADEFRVVDAFVGRAVTIEDGSDLDIVRVNADAVGTAAVQFATSADLASLLIGTGGTATLLANGNRSISMQALTLQSGAVLDLTNNALVIDYTGGSPLNAVRSLLTSGYAAGAWNGAGIRSSTAAGGTTHALGYAEASDIFSAFPANFFGLSVDNTSVVVRYTRYGDANLDGTVNLADFNRVASNFGTSPRSWSQGNFDFDNDVDLSDFNKQASNFGLSA
jgi:acrosin